jgi:hypothetical protein
MMGTPGTTAPGVLAFPPLDHRGPMPAFDAPVRSTVEMLSFFSDQLVDDLDTDAGGLKPWVGHTDGPRLALLSDYLIQCGGGAGEALLDAALAVEEHTQQLTADNTWSVQRQRALTERPDLSESQVMAAMWSRNEHEQRRERRIYASAEHCLAHLVQALDRLSATIVIVAGLKIPALKMGWPALARYAGDPDPKGRVFDAPTEEGVLLQRHLVGLALTWPDHGPSDWLPWLLETRNAMTHRGLSTRMLVSLSERGGGYAGMLRAFYAQPFLSDMQSMAQTGRTRTVFLGGHVIARHSNEVLAALATLVAGLGPSVDVGLPCRALYGSCEQGLTTPVSIQARERPLPARSS